MMISVQRLFTDFGFNKFNSQPEPNLFLEKLNGTVERPNPRVPSTTVTQWICEFGCAFSTEVIKSWRRANIRDLCDTANMAVCLGYLGVSINNEINQIVNQDTLLDSTIQAINSFGRVSGVALSASLCWGTVFYILHHLPRKLPILSREESPADTLAISVNKQDFTSEHHLAITTVSNTIQDQFHTLPQSLIHGLVTEVLLGCWQLNHAHDALNSETPDFQFIVNNHQLPVHQAIKFEHALQQADPAAVKSFLPQLPEIVRHKSIELLETRLLRNICCFIARPIREQRPSVTNFEKGYLKQWLTEYATLTETPSFTELAPSTLIRVIEKAMEQLGHQNMTPLLKMPIDPVENVPISQWPKKLEQQVVVELNRQHGYRLHQDSIPKSGRAIIAFNHSLFTLDMACALQGIREQVNRETNMVIDEALMSLPGINSTFQGLGYRLGEKSTFMRLLTQERLMGVAPGGAREALKPYSHANQLYWNQSKGFIRAHLVSGAPLINIMSPQADQLRKNILPPSIHWLQTNIFGRLKVPYFPILFAPMAREQLRLDHFASEQFEAPPMPVNNLSNNDMRLRRHVDTIHRVITDSAQRLLLDKNEEILKETLDRSYPKAT